MAGLIFFRTNDLEMIRQFYIERIGMELWHDQGQCIILKHENFLMGFCQGNKEVDDPCITFFYDSKEKVDLEFLKLKDASTTDPVLNPRFNIYHFWAKDPEGRTLEFQYFLDKTLKI
ncbi:MAG: VOC family protein [Candidatus Delongbacteria bacterium]|nr:VOC family protein [Candidatus Delongbacteria bacterium]